MAKEQGREIARPEKEEFRKKGGKAVGDQDSTVEGHLSKAAGNSQATTGADPKEIRPKLRRTAKELQEAPAKTKA